MLAVPSTALPIKMHAMFDGLVKGFTWCLALPDSVIGTGVAVLLLLGAIMVRYRRAPTAACHSNIGDFAAIVYVSLQFVTLLTTVSYPNTLRFITPAVIALCGYCFVRLLPLSHTVQVVLTRIAVYFGLLLAVVDFAAWTTEIHILDVFPRAYLAALHANLPLTGGPTQNDSIMLVLAILPCVLASWALERGRNRWFAFLSQIAAAALVAVIALSLSRGIYLAFAAFVAGTFALMKYNRSFSLRLMGSFCLMAAVPVIAAVAYFGVWRAVVETVGNKTVSEQRSTQGRFVTWRDSLRAIEKHPLLGTGGYSDGLESLAWLRDSSDESFTARTYNAPLEAFLSSGLLGLLSYATFLLYPIVRFIGGSRSSMTGVHQAQAFSFLTAGVIALLVRDMTYSSLVLDGRTILVTWTMVALLQNFTALQPNKIVGAHDQAA